MTPPLEHLREAALDGERRLVARVVSVLGHGFQDSSDRGSCARTPDRVSRPCVAVRVSRPWTTRTASSSATGDGYRGDPRLAVGPWSPDALHGGPPAALLARELTHVAGADRADSPLVLARITVELVRPVPRGLLTVEVTPVRPGRRVTLLDAILRDRTGTEVSRARGLFLAPTELDATPVTPPPFPAPEDGTPNDWVSDEPMFATHGMEVRFAQGAFRTVGPSTAWFRLSVPLIAGEPDLPPRRRRRRRGLRQWHRSGGLLGRAHLHQPRPDGVHRARAGRRVGRRPGGHARAARLGGDRRERPVGPPRPDRPGGAGRCWSRAR